MSKAWGPEFGWRMRQYLWLVAWERGFDTMQELADAIGISVVTAYTWRRETEWAFNARWEGGRMEFQGAVDLELIGIWHRGGRAWAGVRGPKNWVGMPGYVPPLLRGTDGKGLMGADLPIGRLHPSAGKRYVGREDRAADRLITNLGEPDAGVAVIEPDLARFRDSEVPGVPDDLEMGEDDDVSRRVTANPVRTNAPTIDE